MTPRPPTSASSNRLAALHAVATLAVSLFFLGVPGRAAARSGGGRASASPFEPTAVVSPAEASPLEAFAAREVRRAGDRRRSSRSHGTALAGRRSAPGPARRPRAAGPPARDGAPAGPRRPSREPLRLEAIVLGDAPSGPVQIAWRPLGSGSWTTVPFERAGRGVWRVALPSPERDFEYAVEATSASGAALQVPAGGRSAPRTVVIAEWPAPQLAR